MIADLHRARATVSPALLQPLDGCVDRINADFGLATGGRFVIQSARGIYLFQGRIKER